MTESRSPRSPLPATLDAHALARLEAIAFRAWPAAHVERMNGVLLRASPGESLRANSAALHEAGGESMASIVAAAESFYAARDQPVRFQIGPTAPAGIDEALAARGYVVASPVWVQTATLDAIDAACEATAHSAEAEIHDAPDDAWIDVEVTRGRFAAIGDAFLSMMRGLGDHAGFGVARVDGVAAGACLAFHEEDIVVLSAMRTLAEARRRGAARALLAAVASWGIRRGAKTAYLQVERDNDAALALYRSAGFTTRYGYHYRVAPSR